MSKIRIYVLPERIAPLVVVDDRETVHKIRKVLSLTKEETVYLFNGRGEEYQYRISDITRKTVTFRKEGLSRKSKPVALEIALAFPLSRESKIDLILQKGTELGVEKFIPFSCSRSMRFPLSLNKVKRWRKVIIEAARQSERLWIPRMEEAMEFNELLSIQYGNKLVACFSGGKISKIIDKNVQKVVIVVGPEGGFSDEEKEELIVNNFISINLSKNILRVETACIFSVGLINYFFKSKNEN